MQSSRDTLPPHARLHMQARLRKHAFAGLAHDDVCAPGMPACACAAPYSVEDVQLVLAIQTLVISTQPSNIAEGHTQLQLQQSSVRVTGDQHGISLRGTFQLCSLECGGRVSLHVFLLECCYSSYSNLSDLLYRKTVTCMNLVLLLIGSGIGKLFRHVLHILSACLNEKGRRACFSYEHTIKNSAIQ
jgi:hypothetical protein